MIIAKPMTLTRSLLLMTAFGASLSISSVSQAQALTPEQLTLQVKRLETYTEKSVIMLNRVDKELTSVKQQLNKVERIIDNKTMIEMSTDSFFVARKVARVPMCTDTGSIAPKCSRSNEFVGA